MREENQMPDTNTPKTTDTAPSLIREQLTIPGYDILTKLGEGGSATVWHARQRSLDRAVAIKVLHHQLGTDPEEVDDFLREARALASVSHPNMITIHDVGQHDGQSYFVMELIEGKTLGHIVRTRGALPEQQALGYVRQVAEALNHAWKSRHLIHRDVKSDNILIDANGQARLADLGIAGIATPSGIDGAGSDKLAGTPNYMAPEQAQGATDIDFHCDIYSLGCVLYELLTGTMPFDGLECDEVLTAQITRTIDHPRKRVPSLSLGATELVRRMMAKNSKERYASWDALIKELRLAIEGKTLPPRRQGKSTVSALVKSPPSSKLAETTNRSHTRKKSRRASPALSIFLKAFTLAGLCALLVRLVDLPPKPILELRRPTPNTPTSPSGATAVHSPESTVAPQPSQPAHDAGNATSTQAHITPENTLASVLDALLAGTPDAARTVLTEAGDGGLDDTATRDIATLIDAVEAAPRLILRGFRTKVGEKTTLIVGTRELQATIKAVSSQGVTADFILPNGHTRETSFGVAKLDGTEQSRWIGPSDSPTKAMAKSILLMQGGDMIGALSEAEQAGSIAPLLTSCINARIQRLTE